MTILEAMDANIVTKHTEDGTIQICETATSRFPEFDHLVEMKKLQLSSEGSDK